MTPEPEDKLDAATASVGVGGDPMATSGENQWPPMGSFPWPPSLLGGVAQSAVSMVCRASCRQATIGRCLGATVVDVGDGACTVLVVDRLSWRIVNVK